MIYRVSVGQREYHLTGTPGIDLHEAYRRFKAGLNGEESQLRELIEYWTPEEPMGDDLEAQAFIACIRENLDLQVRELSVWKMETIEGC